MKVIIIPIDNVSMRYQPGPENCTIIKGTMEVNIEDTYTGIGIHTSVGTFGVCERDWGLEIKKPDGTTVRVQVEQK